LESEFSHSQSTNDGDRHAINVFETALAAAEDETDVAAAKTAKEEAVADLAEFDEAIPIDEQNDVKLSKADMEVQALEKQVIYIIIYYNTFSRLHRLKLHIFKKWKKTN